MTGTMCQLSGLSRELWQLPEDSRTFSEEMAQPQLA